MVGVVGGGGGDWTPPLVVGDSHTVNRNKGSGRNGWRVYVLQKSTPRRVRYNWVVDLGE